MPPVNSVEKLWRIVIMILVAIGVLGIAVYGHVGQEAIHQTPEQKEMQSDRRIRLHLAPIKQELIDMQRYNEAQFKTINDKLDHIEDR